MILIALLSRKSSTQDIFYNQYSFQLGDICNFFFCLKSVFMCFLQLTVLAMKPD